MASPQPADIRQREREDNGLNAVKGFLIFCVVLGHMHAVQYQARPVYDMLYIFHVAGFLILPFLFASPILSRAFINTRSIRYTVPFLWFFTASSILFFLFYLGPEGIGWQGFLGRYVWGLFNANTLALDAASGFKLFWFLPTLFSLVCLRALLVWLPRAGQIALVSGCLLVTCLLGDFQPVGQAIPWGVAIAAFILPLGLSVAWLVQKFTSSPARLASAALAIILLALSWQQGLSVNVGDMTVYGILSAPFKLALFLVTLVATVTALILNKNILCKIPGLTLLGQLSLPVYLTHALVGMLLLKVLGYTPATVTLTQTAILFPAVLVISLAAAYLLVRVPLFSKALFPRNAKDLQEAAQILKKAWKKN